MEGKTEPTRKSVSQAGNSEQAGLKRELVYFSGPQREQKASGERSRQQVREEDSSAQGLRRTPCSMGRGPSKQIFSNGPLLVL